MFGPAVKDRATRRCGSRFPGTAPTKHRHPVAFHFCQSADPPERELNRRLCCFRLRNFRSKGRCPKTRVESEDGVAARVTLAPRTAKISCTFFYRIKLVFDTHHTHRALAICVSSESWNAVELGPRLGRALSKWAEVAAWCPCFATRLSRALIYIQSER